MDRLFRLPRQRAPDDRLEAAHHVHAPHVASIIAFSDVNLSSILEYGVVHLKMEDIIVCGHTRCGGIAAIEDGVHENSIADWLCIATGTGDVLVDGREPTA